MGEAGRSSIGGSVAGGLRSRGREPGTGRLAAVVFGALVVASFAAFAITQRLKHTPAAIQNFEQTPAFYPTARPAAGCHGRVARAAVGASRHIEYLSFKPAQSSPVTVAVVNAAGGEEATLVRDLPVERYKQLSLCWNGQRGPRQRGGRAPAGEYRLRVSVSGRALSVYSPQEFALRGIR